MKNTTRLVTTTMAALACAGCRSSSPYDRASMAREDQADAYAYIAAKYDTDGDGIVQSAEYAREGGHFERLDSNGDGLLSPEDFVGLQVPERGSGMGIGMSQRFMGRYFQVEQDSELSLDELWEGITTHYDGKGDTSADGILTQEEFACTHESRRGAIRGDNSPMVKKFMDPHDPWAVMAAQVDLDDDADMERDEFAAFFDSFFDGEPFDYGPKDETADADEEDDEDALIAPVGERAPDFTLTTVDGKTSHTISKFAGDRPVALIFGSYT
jgi:hypothetical protein